MLRPFLSEMASAEKTRKNIELPDYGQTDYFGMGVNHVILDQTLRRIGEARLGKISRWGNGNLFEVDFLYPFYACDGTAQIPTNSSFVLCQNKPIDNTVFFDIQFRFDVGKT